MSRILKAVEDAKNRQKKIDEAKEKDALQGIIFLANFFRDYDKDEDDIAEILIDLIMCQFGDEYRYASRRINNIKKISGIFEENRKNLLPLECMKLHYENGEDK